MHPIRPLSPLDNLAAALSGLRGGGMPEGVDYVTEYRPPAGPLTPEKEKAIKYLQRLRKAFQLQEADLEIKRLERLRAEAGRAKLNWATLRALRNMEGSIPIDSEIVEDPAKRDSIPIDSEVIGTSDPAPINTSLQGGALNPALAQTVSTVSCTDSETGNPS